MLSSVLTCQFSGLMDSWTHGPVAVAKGGVTFHVEHVEQVEYSLPHPHCRSDLQVTDGSTAVNIAITLKQFALLGIPSWHDFNNAFQCLVETWDVLNILWIWYEVGMKTYFHHQWINDLWLQNYVWVLGWVISIFYSIWPILSEIEMMLHHWTIEQPQSRRMSLHSPRANHTILCWLWLLWIDFVYENAMRRYNLMIQCYISHAASYSTSQVM